MTLVLVALAVARATRLVRDDTIFSTPREAFYGWLSVDGHRIRNWAFELLRCPWCISGWLAAGAMWATDWRTSIPMPPLWWLACWWVACMGYWLVELVAETHDQIWEKREHY